MKIDLTEARVQVCTNQYEQQCTEGSWLMRLLDVGKRGVEAVVNELANYFLIVLR